MHLTKSSLRLGSKRMKFAPLLQHHRLVSSSSHDGHHASEDPNVYSKETFYSPFWRNTAIFSLLGYGAFLFLSSEKNDQPFLTRYIARFTPSTAHWDTINDGNLIVAAVTAEENKLIQDARKPHIHRFKYTGFFDSGIQNNIPLGGPKGIEQAVVRTDYEIRNFKRKSDQ